MSREPVLQTPRRAMTPKRRLEALARKARTHCKRNHPLAGDNLFLTSSGGRGCKACRRIHKATHRSKANG